MKELESIGRLWAEFAAKNNLDPKHVDVSKLKETNPQAYTQFNEIVDLDGIMFNFSNPNWHTVYHELAHIFDYEQKNMNGYEHNKDWNKRSHEVTAEVSALVRMLSNEFGSKEQLEAEWPNTRVGYDNIINTYLHGEMQLADRKNLLKKLFQVRDHLLKTLA
jgi:predicted SprT family Zn-dependent metalloprotease